jgi:hypothetical protein
MTAQLQHRLYKETSWYEVRFHIYIYSLVCNIQCSLRNIGWINGCSFRRGEGDGETHLFGLSLTAYISQNRQPLFPIRQPLISLSHGL